MVTMEANLVVLVARFFVLQSKSFVCWSAEGPAFLRSMAESVPDEIRVHVMRHTKFEVELAHICLCRSWLLRWCFVGADVVTASGARIPFRSSAGSVAVPA
jgi:hypothetical protein